MLVSVVVRSKDEGRRLRLALTSLARQSAPAEVIVVDDGSSDDTADVVAEASHWLPLRIVSHAAAKGRSAAANAGARQASGEILLFLDGDNIASPDLVERHAAIHAGERVLVGRGETFHLRGTRFFSDPEIGTPWPDTAAHVAELSASDKERLRLTRQHVLEDFAAIEKMAEPGIYPGAGPRRLYELEMDALRNHPDCSVLWAAASGCNLSMPRSAFVRAGGFDERLDINEHRELALRLCRLGARIVPVEGARTYHMTHRSGWRDPLRERGWEDIFYSAQPIPEVRLLTLFWASLSPAHRIPREGQINSLPELEAAARGEAGIDAAAAWRAALEASAPLRDIVK